MFAVLPFLHVVLLLLARTHLPMVRFTLGTGLYLMVECALVMHIFECLRKKKYDLQISF